MITRKKMFSSIGIQDITRPKYNGTDIMIKDVKPVVDTDMDGKLQMLDACQTFLNKARSCMVIATSEMKDNYSKAELSRLSDIVSEIEALFDKVGNEYDKLC